MKKEQFVEQIRNKIGRNRALGWILMQDVGRLFDKLCVPGDDTIPDDPIMRSPEMDTVAAMWGQINSVQGQAESSEKTHHDYADAIAVTLIATANVLSYFPDNDDNVMEFKRLTKLSPTEFLAKLE